MINKVHSLAVKRQCELLDISRSGIYYGPVPVKDRDIDLMRIMDEIHLKEPYLGLRGMRNVLRMRGYQVGRIHVRTLHEEDGYGGDIQETLSL